MNDLAGLIAQAGFAPGTPVGLARVMRYGAVEDVVSGAWPDGRPVGPRDPFYVASLAKQVTGVAAALLVRDGRLDADAPVSRYLRGLPDWANDITPRQLAHHVSGLPAAGEIEARGSGDWTAAQVLAALGDVGELRHSGTYVYSNVGYVLLAKIVAAAGDEPFDRFVQSRLFDPLDLRDMAFVDSQIEHFAQASRLGSSRPLTMGDGGLWSSAASFARWLDAQNRDVFGVASIVEAPVPLAEGLAGDYGWGIGIRTYRGERSFIHGGQWEGAVAKAVRIPARGLSVVAMAAGLSVEALDALIDPALQSGGSA